MTILQGHMKCPFSLHPTAAVSFELGCPLGIIKVTRPNPNAWFPPKPAPPYMHHLPPFDKGNAVLWWLLLFTHSPLPVNRQSCQFCLQIPIISAAPTVVQGTVPSPLGSGVVTNCNTGPFSPHSGWSYPFKV